MMNAMVLDRICDLAQENDPLTLSRLPVPDVGGNQVLVKVTVCGVCHTELDEIEGRTPPPRLPVVPGHQVVGRVAAKGHRADRFSEGDRVGVAWIYSACGRCDYCRTGLENLCAGFKATGRDANGGYAQYMSVDQDFAYPLPDTFSDEAAAPLLCAGAIGYRSLSLAGLRNGQLLGLTGFGASAHLVLKMVRYQYPDCEIFAFARNPEERDFARELGAVWAGDTGRRPPARLHCIIDTTPAWKPVIHALEHLRPSGRLVINAIRKEGGDQDALKDIDYERHLWMEKEIKSVANVGRQDVQAFLDLAAHIPIIPETQSYGLEEANQALLELKQRKIRGAKVLIL